MEKGILNWKANKLMKALGVDEAAEAEFQREKQEAYVNIGYIGAIVITENWMFIDTGWSKTLLPLKEIALFKKDYRSSRYNVSFYVELLFAGGKKYWLPCEWRDLDDLTEILKERCPQAEMRKNSEYLTL